MAVKVVGVEPGSSEEYQRKAAAWHACKAADVDVPKKLADYFGGKDPVTKVGAEVEIPSIEITSGVEIDVAAVPNNIQKIRFITK